MSSAEWIAAIRSGATSGAVTGLPYAGFLGVRFERHDDGLRFMMPFHPRLVGVVQTGRLHGGTTAGLLEITALSTLVLALPADEPLPKLKPISVTVDYLREGAPQDVFAAATITRLGRRIANLRAEAWQDDRTRPIAGAHLNILLDRG